MVKMAEESTCPPREGSGLRTEQPKHAKTKGKVELDLQDEKDKFGNISLD